MLTRASSRLRRILHVGTAGEARTAGSRRIAANIGMQMTWRVVGMASGFVTFPLIARMLGADGFGVWTAALAYVSLFGSMTEFGLTNAAMLRMSADPDDEAEWLGALASLRTLMATGATLLCIALIPVALDGDSQLVALILSLTIVAGGANALMSVYQSRLRGAIPLAIGLLQAVVWMAMVIVLTIVDVGPVVMACAYTALLSMIAVIQFASARRLARVLWRGVRARWRSLLRVAVPIGLSGFFVTIYYKIDAVLLLRVAGEHEAGVYGVAYRFLDAIGGIPGAIMVAVFPVMSAAFAADRPRVQRLVQRCAELMAVVSLPALAVTIVLSGPLVAFMFGEGFDESAAVLPVLMVAFVAICYGNLAGFLAPVLDLQWRLTIFAAVGATVNVGLNILLIPRYGALGAAWVTAITESLTMLCLLATCLRRLDLRLGVGRLARAVLAAVLMALAMRAAQPLGLAVALVAGGAVYPLALWKLRVVLVSDLRRLRSEAP